MFREEDIFEFIRGLVVTSESTDDAIIKLQTVKKYLELTMMADNEDLNMIDRVIISVPHLFALQSYLDLDEIHALLPSNDGVKTRKKASIPGEDNRCIVIPNGNNIFPRK